jgi:hypothetical protein
MPEPDPRPINLSLLSQLALAFVPSAPPARAGSCMGAKGPEAEWPLCAIEMLKQTFIVRDRTSWIEVKRTLDTAAAGVVVGGERTFRPRNP